jgi:lipoyl-dependent peroxiredoxin subunit D
MNETLQAFAENLKIEAAGFGTGVQELASTDSRYLRDLRVNVANALAYENLSKKEAVLIALATAINEKSSFTEVFKSLAKEQGTTPEEIAEVYACVSLLSTNNVFYKFRHFTENDFYKNTPAGIKMTIMARPILGKEFFELLSLAISALNGCEMCVKAHEHSVKELGCSEARVYDAIIKGFLVIA